MELPQACFETQFQLLSRRLGYIPGRRFALAATSVILASALAAAPAWAESGQRVVATVYAPGHNAATDSVSVATLEADDQGCPTYTGPSNMEEHDPDANPSLAFSTTTLETWSMATVLSCLSTPIQAASIAAVTIHESNGAPEASSDSQLSPADLSSPSDFLDPTESPVLSDQGTTVVYLRPWRGGNDNNASDRVEVGDGGELDIDVFEGMALGVGVTASATTVTAGTTVSFSATVTRADGEHLVYNWDFEGAAQDSSVPSPEVQFSNPGKYRVSLEVTDAAAGSGGAATIPITVQAVGGTPPPASAGNPQPDGGANPDANSLTGPTDGTPAQDGAGKKKKNGKPSTSDGTRTGPSPTARKPNEHGSTDHRQTNQSPAAASGGSGGSSGSGSSGGSGASGGSGSSAFPASSSPTISTARGLRAHRVVAHHNKPGTATPAARAPIVRGLLISDVTPVPAGASPFVRTAAGGAPAPALRRTVRTSPIVLIGSVLAVLLLLGLGARRELRGRSGWRAPPGAA